MKTLELKSRKLLRTLFGCFSFTAIAFIFQACYGMPKNFDAIDVQIKGRVTSKTTNLPIQGIKVKAKDSYGISDEEGKFNFYTIVFDDTTRGKEKTIHVYVSDIDSVENGHFADTSFAVKTDYKNKITLDVELEDFQSNEQLPHEKNP